MAITLVQHTSSNVRATSLSLAYASNTTAGNLLVAIVCCSTGGSTMNAPTSTGLTWTGVGLQNNGGTQVQIFYVANCPGGAVTVNATTTTGRDMELLIAEYSGVATSSPLDVSAGANAATVNLTTTNANDVIVVGVSGNQSTAWTGGTGFTLREAQGADQGDGAFEDQIVSVAQLYTCAFGGGTGTAAIQAAAFKQAAAGGGSTTHFLACLGAGG